MSLFNTLQTSVSGMAAQSNALSVIGDNIANSQTTGYKEAQAQFETVLGSSGGGEYESGGVKTDIRYGIATQGTSLTTSSPTDLAIQGNGFFVVSKGDGSQFLTRAGSFVPDTNGNLVNSAGYNLMGYAVGANGPSTQLSVVNVSSSGLTASPSTAGTLSANLNSTAAVVSGDTPSSNLADATFTSKTSVTVYDKLGTADVYDVYMTKTAGATAPVAASAGPPAVAAQPATSGTWQVAAYPQGDATNGGFPYTNGGTNDSPATTTLKFDTSGNALSGAGLSTSLSIAVPNGNTVKIDLSKTTQLAAGFAIESSTMDGNTASALKSVSVGKDGTVSAVYASGKTSAIYDVPLASVISPDNLTPINGNVYQVSSGSGPMILSTANAGVVGSIASNSLEQSTVDLATELTNMITAQRGYEANSKVLQAASSLLGNLNQIQTN